MKTIPFLPHLNNTVLEINLITPQVQYIPTAKASVEGNEEYLLKINRGVSERNHQRFPLGTRQVSDDSCIRPIEFDSLERIRKMVSIVRGLGNSNNIVNPGSASASL